MRRWVFTKFLQLGLQVADLLLHGGSGEDDVTCAQPVGNLCRRTSTDRRILPEGEPTLPTVQPIMLTAFRLRFRECFWL